MINSFTHDSGATYHMWYSPDKIGRHFAKGTLYERPFLDWIHAQQFRGAALDVGANIGNHTMWMAVVCQLNVYAFEPVLPHVVRANADLNGILAGGPNQRYENPSVTVFDFALGDTETVGHHKAKGVVVPGSSDQSTDETFQIRELDSMGWGNIAPNQTISFIKIDVEGMEDCVLRGGQHTIYDHRPVIATEEWGPAATKSIAQVLLPMNYKRTQTFGGRGKAPMAIWKPA